MPSLDPLAITVVHGDGIEIPFGDTAGRVPISRANSWPMSLRCNGPGTKLGKGVGKQQ